MNNDNKYYDHSSSSSNNNTNNDNNQINHQKLQELENQVSKGWRKRAKTSSSFQNKTISLIILKTVEKSLCIGAHNLQEETKSIVLS